MALAADQRGAAQRHLMVHIDVVADFGGFADHHAHAVVDHQPATQPGAGMDFDAREEPAEMGEHPRRQVNAPRPHRMGQAVPHLCVQSGVAEQNLKR